mmetsp:Transcript_11964/g.21725  ORF Transcript_11964/g.21725 Transcript_11964/m.21725 type:complete len:605 (-) Transcript_11964:1164-2978(-)
MTPWGVWMVITTNLVLEALAAARYGAIGLSTTSNLDIPDSSFTSSGQLDTTTGPEQSRLYNANYGGGWVGEDGDNSNLDQWLQVDLLNPQLVVKIETQGRSRAQHWVTHYRVLSSIDGATWTPYIKGGKEHLFEGNNDRHKVREQILEPPVFARYVRFNPRNWYLKPAMRVELWVCRGPACLDPVEPKGNIMPVGIGIRSRLNIPDHQMTCSGHMDPPPTQEEEKARKTSGKGMCPVELKRELKLQREAAAKEEAKEEQRLREERLEEHAAHLTGNQSTSPRVVPLAVPALRHESCDQRYVAHQARLWNIEGGGGWAPEAAVVGSWLEIDMGAQYVVRAIVTQGREHADQYVSEYYITTKPAFGLYNVYSNPEGMPHLFAGNTDHRLPRVNPVEHAPMAQYVRIYPTKWKSYPTMRVEILVCEVADPDCKPFPVGIGVPSHQAIQDEDLTASSFLGWFAPHHGRLHNTAGGGGWIPDHFKEEGDHWLQVDLKTPYFLGQVATQGIIHKATWTTKYKVSYSSGGHEWTFYEEGGSVRIFEGNMDQNSVVMQTFARPFRAQLVRIHPLEWSWTPGLRFELYEVLEQSYTIPSADLLSQSEFSLGGY